MPRCVFAWSTVYWNMLKQVMRERSVTCNPVPGIGVKWDRIRRKPRIGVLTCGMIAAAMVSGRYHTHGQLFRRLVPGGKHSSSK